MGYLICAILFLVVIGLYGSGSKTGKSIAKEFGVKDDGDACSFGCLSIVIIIVFSFFVLMFVAMMIH
jgi:hypothetical protein